MNYADPHRRILSDAMINRAHASLCSTSGKGKEGRREGKEERQRGKEIA